MTAKQIQSNLELASLNADIAQAESILQELYRRRRGRIQWRDPLPVAPDGELDSGVQEAWCTCCGRNKVAVEFGWDTCGECTQAI